MNRIGLARTEKRRYISLPCAKLELYFRRELKKLTKTRLCASEHNRYGHLAAMSSTVVELRFGKKSDKKGGKALPLEKRVRRWHGRQRRPWLLRREKTLVRYTSTLRSRKKEYQGLGRSSNAKFQRIILSCYCR